MHEEYERKQIVTSLTGFINMYAFRGHLPIDNDSTSPNTFMLIQNNITHECSHLRATKY